ncbi:MAG: hypothetical protein P8K71_01780 [Actinomycetota bacterium]|nr:hypothetical protein [Actinomycetota bacterium]
MRRCLVTRKLRKLVGRQLLFIEEESFSDNALLAWEAIMGFDNSFVGIKMMNG